MIPDRKPGALILFPDRPPSPSLVVWDWVNEVYPKQLHVRAVSESEPLKKCERRGGHVVQGNYDLTGCGRVFTRWYEAANGALMDMSVFASLSPAVDQDMCDEVYCFCSEHRVPTANHDVLLGRIESILLATVTAAVLSWYTHRKSGNANAPTDPALESLLLLTPAFDPRGLVWAMPNRRPFAEWHPFPEV